MEAYLNIHIQYIFFKATTDLSHVISVLEKRKKLLVALYSPTILLLGAHEQRPSMY